MYTTFVRTANVNRFLSAVSAIDQRGASEASWLLISGDAGLGKSKTAEWWATHNDAIEIRLKAAATPHWFLTDLVGVLGEVAPAHSCEKLFYQAMDHLSKSPQPIVVDEVENVLKGDRLETLEMVRDISDMTEAPVILVGREYVWGRLSRHKHFRTRISARADFSPLSLEDVTKCFGELSEVPVDEEVIADVHKASEGHIREVVNAIANAERIGKRAPGETVTRKSVGNTSLVRDWQRTKAGAV
ncbi:MAG: AAA family ATPase [Magnetospiraceae bacterium]